MDTKKFEWVKGHLTDLGIDLRLADIIQAICEFLPEGWNISLELEQGSGDFELYTPEGNHIHSEVYSSVDFTLERRGFNALEYAIDKSIICKSCQKAKYLHELVDHPLQGELLLCGGFLSSLFNPEA